MTREKKGKDVHSVTPEVVVDFLKKTIPFHQLPKDTLDKIAKEVTIDFFPEGTIIFKQQETVVEHLYIIQKGGVKIYLKDEEGMVTLKDFRGEGSYIGALPMIHGATANLNVETVEDTFCFLLPKETFLKLINEQAGFAQFYLKSFSDKFIRTAYAELRHHKVAPRTEGALYLFSVTVKDLIKREPITIQASQTVQKAAIEMARHHIGSLLVRDEQDEIIGIITDKDLRNKVVAKARPYNTAVSDVMSSPVATIDSDTICFDALLYMMRNRIHHLGLKKGKKVIGVITSHDIMVLQGSSPIYLFREIVAQNRIEDIYPLAKKIPLIVRTLIEEGAKANNITRMITILNDHILSRILFLLESKFGAPPLPYCWLLMGSEGRKEQTFKTDQDNALIFQDPENQEQGRACSEYFARFAAEAVEHLEKCGYSKCPGEIMASNPKWCQPYSSWQQTFDGWILKPEPKEILHSTIFFDFRPGYGTFDLGFRLRDHLSATIPQQEIFLFHLAKDCLEARPPLTFFRNFIVEKDGEHRNSLDIKKRGLVPFVDFARLFALKFGLKETNTVRRLEALHEQEHISKELFSETVEAYEFQMQLRFIHQLRCMEEGREPDNYIRPSDLTDIEKQTLKEAFGVINRLHSVIKETFPMI